MRMQAISVNGRRQNVASRWVANLARGAVDRLIGALGRTALVLLGWLLLLPWPGNAQAQLTMTNVTVVDVTPAGFSVVWQATAPGTPELRIYTDAAAGNEITSDFELTPFPLRGGDPTVTDRYGQQEYGRTLRGVMQAGGLYRIAAHGGTPGATYYVEALTVGAQETAASALLPVTLPLVTGFQVEARQFQVEIAETDPLGWLVLARHAGAAYPVSGVAGDGSGPASAYLELANFFTAAGQSLPLTGTQALQLTVMGTGGVAFDQSVSQAFSGTFTVAQLTRIPAGLATELALTLIEPADRQYAGNAKVQIGWDDTARFVDGTVALYYDSDAGGADGTLIVNGLSEDADGAGDLYLWDTTGVADGTYYLYGTLTDGRQTINAYAAGPVTIDHTGTDSDGDLLADSWEQFYFHNLDQDGDGDLLLDNDGAPNRLEAARHTDPTRPDTRLDLAVGTNLVAIPLTFAPAMTAGDLLLRLGPALRAISRVNPGSQQLERLTYNGGVPAGVDFPLTPDAGYFLEMDWAKQATLTGQAATQSIDLAVGSNLVGFVAPGPASDTAYELLQTLGPDKVISIQRYNSTTGLMEMAGFYRNAPVGINFPIVRGTGYTLVMRQAVVGFTAP